MFKKTMFFVGEVKGGRVELNAPGENYRDFLK